MPLMLDVDTQSRELVKTVLNITQNLCDNDKADRQAFSMFVNHNKQSDFDCAIEFVIKKGTKYRNFDKILKHSIWNAFKIQFLPSLNRKTFRSKFPTS